MNATSGKLSKSNTLSLTYQAITQVSVLVALYCVLLFTLPVSHTSLYADKFNLFEYHILRFAVAIPSMVVWLTAFVGVSTLKQYANSLKDTPEGEPYERLANGCAWLAWSLPITSLISIILSAFSAKWPGFSATATILNNYLGLVLPLIAFSVIGMSSRSLVSKAELTFRLASARLIMVLFLAAGVLYCFFTFKNFDLQSIGSTANPYFLPIWLMVISVIIPYLYVWFVGLLACYEITLYSQQIKGVLYRRGLRLLVSGLTTIIISSIALQYVNGVAPNPGHLVLNGRLIITVSFRIIGGIGFILLTMGALRLKKIEEV